MVIHKISFCHFKANHLIWVIREKTYPTLLLTLDTNLE